MRVVILLLAYRAGGILCLDHKVTVPFWPLAATRVTRCSTSALGRKRTVVKASFLWLCTFGKLRARRISK